MDLSLQQALAERVAFPRPYPEGRFAERGIVTCAGGRRYFTCVWVLIWVLRRVVRSSLPIQVWHAGRGEMSEGMQLILEEEGVEVADAASIVGRHPARVSGGWPLKPYAIAQSRFREVLFLDADTVPLANPDAAFDWDPYRREGLLLWPDVLDIRKDNPIWRRLALEPADCTSLESSVLVIDKARAWDVLDVARLLNEHWEETYDLIYGDKDSYLLAARLLGRSFGLIEARPFRLGDDLVQRDQHGEPFVHHRTGSKWNLFGANQPVIDPRVDSACELALAELRRRWTGAVFHAPSRSPAARAAERDLIETRRFHYSASGRLRPLELLSGARVGEGRGDREQHWAIVERGGLVLQFFSDVYLAVELTQDGDGTWRGGSVRGAPFDARLAADYDSQPKPDPGPDGALRSAAHHIPAILAPSLFASGFDRSVARELGETLRLLNRVFDDVPEQVTIWIRTGVLAEEWRLAVEALLSPLSQARDARRAQTCDGVTFHALNPEHYRRVL